MPTKQCTTHYKKNVHCIYMALRALSNPFIGFIILWIIDANMVFFLSFFLSFQYIVKFYSPISLSIYILGEYLQSPDRHTHTHIDKAIHTRAAKYYRFINFISIYHVLYTSLSKLCWKFSSSHHNRNMLVYILMRQYSIFVAHIHRKREIMVLNGQEFLLNYFRRRLALSVFTQRPTSTIISFFFSWCIEILGWCIISIDFSFLSEHWWPFNGIWYAYNMYFFTFKYLRYAF